MRIKKILNNNAAVVSDGDTEQIVMGSGIAFQKQKNDPVDKSCIEKIFVMKDEAEQQMFQELLTTLPEEHIQVAEDIISYAEKELGVAINEHIHIALTDHLSFALERLNQGMVIKNTLLNEIKILYPAEFRIGLFAQELIKKELGIAIPEDEVGYIALHIHTAKMNAGEMSKTMDITSMIQSMVRKIESLLQMDVEMDMVSYERLVTNLRFAVQRSQSTSPADRLDPVMVEIIKDRFAESFYYAMLVGQMVLEEYGFTFHEAELADITTQIERVKTRVKTF